MRATCCSNFQVILSQGQQYSSDLIADQQPGPKLVSYEGWCIPGIGIERNSGDHIYCLFCVCARECYVSRGCIYNVRVGTVPISRSATRSEVSYGVATVRALCLARARVGSCILRSVKSVKLCYTQTYVNSMYLSPQFIFFFYFNWIIFSNTFFSKFYLYERVNSDRGYG